MKLLEERIRKDGIVKSDEILKVDSFLNHQIDIRLYDQIGAEFARLFADRPVNKILTIEASGIGIACVTALHFDVPVFIKTLLHVGSLVLGLIFTDAIVARAWTILSVGAHVVTPWPHH